MKKFLSSLWAIVALIALSVSGNTFAQQQKVVEMASNAGGSRVGAVSMEMKQVAPGLLDFTFRNAGVNFLNDLVVPEGITDVTTEDDSSGKGPAKNVAYASHPKIFAQYQVCLTVSGPNNYAGNKTNTKFETSKMNCVKAAPTMTIRVKFKDHNDQLYGLTPVLVRSDGQMAGWSWHGMDAYSVIARPGTSKPDWVTVVYLNVGESRIVHGPTRDNPKPAPGDEALWTRFEGEYTKGF